MSTGLVLFECARELARDPQDNRMRERIISADRRRAAPGPQE